MYDLNKWLLTKGRQLANQTYNDAPAGTSEHFDALCDRIDTLTSENAALVTTIERVEQLAEDWKPTEDATKKSNTTWHGLTAKERVSQLLYVLKTPYRSE